MRLEQFLIKAKLHTYAGSGEGGERLLEDGCKELGFQEGEFKYRDRYFGWNPFVGEEVVWQGEQIVWAMNYYGVVLTETVSPSQVYGFLQKALGQVKEDRPFRGPAHWREGDWEYVDESQGAVERFLGVEQILYSGQVVYRLDYHGGKVK
jgi:hypothetical protein